MSSIDNIILNGVTYDIGGSGGGVSANDQLIIKTLAQNAVYQSDMTEYIDDLFASTPTETCLVLLSLSNCTSSNTATSVTRGSGYSTTISANNGYEISSVTASMGGQSVTVSNNSITIPNVTGTIQINAVATAIPSGGAYREQYDAYNESWHFCTGKYISSGGSSISNVTYTDRSNCDMIKITRPSWAKYFAVFRESGGSAWSKCAFQKQDGSVYLDGPIPTIQADSGRSADYETETMSEGKRIPIPDDAVYIYVPYENTRDLTYIGWYTYPLLEEGSTPVIGKLYMVDWVTPYELNGETGETNSNATYSTSGYIVIPNGCTKYGVGTADTTIRHSGAYYDLGKNYISGEKMGDQTTYNWNTSGFPNNAVYFRFSTYSSFTSYRTLLQFKGV